MKRLATALPLTAKVPILVVALMLGLSALMTHAVLDRLSETQERHVRTVATTFLDGLVSALQPYVLRSDHWEVFDAIDRSGAIGPDFGRANLIVTDAQGMVIAASNPTAQPVGTTYPADSRGAAPLAIDPGAGRAFARRPVAVQGRTIGWVHADFSIAHLLRERSEVLRTLVLTNAMIALLLALIGYLVVRRMLSPVSVLSRHLGLAAEGRPKPIPSDAPGYSSVEFGRLFRQYEAMADAVKEREAMATRLAEEERLASLGKLASGMAHEINNPLGGLFNALDTLRRHGDREDVRRSTLELIGRGLEGIRSVVRTALATYRREPDTRSLIPADLDDLRTLVRPELDRRSLSLTWETELPEVVPVPASAVRQIALNLLLNAAQASPVASSIEFAARVSEVELALEVGDHGPGLPSWAVDTLRRPSATAVAVGKEHGLGLWTTGRLVNELGGEVDVSRDDHEITRVRVRIPLTKRPEDLRHAA